MRLLLRWERRAAEDLLLLCSRIVGRKAAVAEFDYSDAMPDKSRRDWRTATLDCHILTCRAPSARARLAQVEVYDNASSVPQADSFISGGVR